MGCIVPLLCCSVNMILVKDSAPTPEVLGATNGLVQGAMYFFRAIAPAFIRYISSFPLTSHSKLECLQNACRICFLHGIQLGIRAVDRGQSVGRASLGCRYGLYESCGLLDGEEDH